MISDPKGSKELNKNRYAKLDAFQFYLLSRQRLCTKGCRD
jgi:hypothetical protein